MTAIARETDRIRRREIHLHGPYTRPRRPDDLRVVFLSPYQHAYSLLATGPMALYDLVNRNPDIPAIAERALAYECLVADANRLRTPDGEPYRSIENPTPVADADIVGVSVTNAGDLHSVLRLLDVAGIPRRSADRAVGRHPLVVGGSGGLANPEPMADFLDIVALGEAERSFLDLIRLVHQHRDGARAALLEQAARIPGLYVPSLYEHASLPGGGTSAIHARTPAAPDTVRPQYLTPRDLGPAHFTSPISDGTCALIIANLGCKHSCHMCTLGTPPFRNAPIEQLTDYVDTLEQHGIRKIIISSPTFTQYRHRDALLDRIAAYADRAPEPVSVIIGSVRADEVTAGYLDTVAHLDPGHLFTELSLDAPRGVITIAPEFAADNLVSLFGKTMDEAKVGRALDLCRATTHFGTVMLYFMVGAPGETQAERLAIADYALRVFERLGRPDGAVIVKLQQFMPQPGTVSQRLPMADPDLVNGWVTAIRDRLTYLAGPTHDRFRVLWGEHSRLLLEAVCGRGDRRVGHALEHLHDAGTDFTHLTKAQLDHALALHGLTFDQHLRTMDTALLPWHVINTVNPEQERTLAAALHARTAIPA
ncbi:radical SAM protein [Streptomyces seoulensis]|uniref:radical SAM protein n=1 Tax=Streptomyces seoulensis TaxID=73044 RepID=UPI001FCB1288|nr:radical SAM protein [Streptomyces seoulensis]BDH07156.1 B12-binding domain-containing radical SAM protein [Streptomyces seoulensis]